MNLHQSVIEACAFRLEESKERIQICIDKLSENQLVYRYNAVSNSIANIVIHLQGNITQYILSGLGGQADLRIRDEEFLPASSIDKSKLAADANRVFAAAVDIIRKLTEEQCTQKLVLQGFEMTGIGAVIHVVEHASYHVGQITYLTKMYTSEETAYYADVDLNIHNE